MSNQATSNLYPAVAMYGPYNIKDNLVEGDKKLWCACGLSKKQPWCDDGEVSITDCQVLGELSITDCQVLGELSITDCQVLGELSSHKGTGISPLIWTVPKTQTLFQICACKYTKDPPFCDATHTYLPLDVLKRQKECKKPHTKETKLCTGCGKVPDW